MALRVRPMRAGAGRDELGARRLRRAFRAGGAVATVAGMHTVLTGGRSLPARRLEDPSVESELRFYSAFYVAYGLLVLSAAPRADRDARTVRALSGALFLAGLARAGAWRAAGPPHPVQRALLALELSLPPAVVGWQARLARSGRRAFVASR